MRVAVIAAAIIAAAAAQTSYDDDGGKGDRTRRIQSNMQATGIIELVLLDGLQSRQTFASGSVAGRRLTWDFGTRHVIDSARIVPLRTMPTPPLTMGRWQWRASNDGAAWTPIGGEFDLPNGFGYQNLTTLAGNTTAYRYYEMFGISGDFVATTPITEIEFQIGPPTVPYEPTVQWRTGDRRARIIMSRSAFDWDSPAGPQLLNGQLTDSGAPAPGDVAGHWIQFDFRGATIIDRAVWHTAGAGTSGIWQWQGSADAETWDDIGQPFTFPQGPAMYYYDAYYHAVMQELANNRTAYRYYRVLGISGTFGPDAWREIEFRQTTPALSTPLHSLGALTPDTDTVQ